jgi:hypothetical protein
MVGVKRYLNWQIKLAITLISLSLAFYTLHYLIFKDLHQLVFYLISDIAFLFLNVLIVMLVLNQLLEHQEKQSTLKKLNMAIGTFFIEVGTDLIRKLSAADRHTAALGKKLAITANWDPAEFTRARKNVAGHSNAIDVKEIDLNEIRGYLQAKRTFMLRLLENPNLLEHEAFTDLLWAVFHLTDELSHRRDFKVLPASDLQHLGGDIKRAYQHLLMQWLEYMKHLKNDYPYLFSLAVRTNPFNAAATIEVME